MSEGKKAKYSANRRLLLKTKLLKRAATMLVAEDEKRRIERENTLNERVPPLQMSGFSAHDLQELCKDLHRKIDAADEARYDLDVKIQYLTQKILDLKGKLQRPNLKRVKKSTEAMLGNLDSKMTKSSDFKVNLKTVKKEDEKKEELTDWRKNVEAMSGMEGRKKLFDAGQ